jgi:TatD DNase family protein
MAVCASALRGVKKTNVGAGEFIENYGLKNDGHAGDWHRQVSLLSYDCVQAFCAQGAKAGDGDFGENLLVRGIDFKMLPVGTKLYCGSVILEITQIGKECHSRCGIYEQMGDCIMPREGVFARVLQGGKIAVGDELYTL